MVVIGAGTSGTVSGVGNKIKERCPHCVVVAVDPLGSILAVPDELNQTDVSYYEVKSSRNLRALLAGRLFNAISLFLLFIYLNYHHKYPQLLNINVLESYLL